MLRKSSLIVLISFLTASLVAQVEFKNREFSLATENDAYLLLGNDRYYSNGIIAHYRWVPRHNFADSSKVIFDIEVAQKTYTPQDLLLFNIDDFHRPYAGLLYAGINMSRFKKKTSRAMFGIEAGISGQGSGAEGFQEWYHDTFGFPAPQGWEYQIPGEFIFNFKSEFNRQIIITPGSFDLISSTELSLGTAFTHGIQRFDFRVGKLQWLSNSSFKNALIGAGSESTPKHNYLILGYGLQYVAHNLTIDGSIWNDDAPHTEVSTPWVRHLRIGWVSNSDKATFKLTYNWSSPETRTSGRHAYLAMELLLRFSPKETK